MKTLIILMVAMIIHPFLAMEDTGYEVGDEAMNFKLKNVDGNMVSLSDYPESKGFIVVFTCNTCPFAQLYEDRIIALSNKYASKGYPVIAINPNDPAQKPGDSFKAMKERASEKNYTFPYLVDETQMITRTYGATNTPHMFVLKKVSDKFIVKYIGTIDNNPRNPENATTRYVEDAVDALLNGKEVPVKNTKAIGCSIKWKST